MDTITFCLHAAVAALLGTAIGLEREWGQHPAGLRTNALVAFGACLFVSLAHLLGGAPTPSHIAGQLVVGVGFLGGGVIMREGLNVKGLNTAATLWCTAAVGALTGAGLLLEGVIAAAGVVALHLALRPVSDRINRRLRRATNVETMYRLRVICRAGHEGTVRERLCRFFHDHATMTIQGIATRDGETPDRVSVVADVHSERRDDRTMEEVMRLLTGEPDVLAVSWEKATSM